MPIGYIDVGPRGEKVEILTEGFKGDGCKEFSKPILERIGGKTESYELTSEAYETAPDQVNEHLGQ